ncbi:hypothetical protein IGI04_006157 [Brassica rapa subsp. trilocularis]|uniref:Uncharacterized protein n=1 Tax=Brassica rapa subsp. trilocularis TaxID=1813537 RepID=A0ABQ7NG41_BRACM|nr:hypothetical protein IGI04_006157 [Brassica rapa subsp. trilocularis]
MKDVKSRALSILLNVSSDWQIEAAFDVLYSQPQPKSNGDMRRLKELFNRYKGNMLFLMCFMVLFILKPFATTCLCHCELGLYKAQVMLPFNAFGTMAMARKVSSFSSFLSSQLNIYIYVIVWLST